MNPKRWEIYRASLDPVVGSEQGKSRPVVIISEDEINELLNTVNELPITTRKKGRTVYPNEALLNENENGLQNESIILCHQIRTIDKIRLTQKYGNITVESKKNEIIDSLCFQLAIKD